MKNQHSATHALSHPSIAITQRHSSTMRTAAIHKEAA